MEGLGRILDHGNAISQACDPFRAEALPPDEVPAQGFGPRQAVLGIGSPVGVTGEEEGTRPGGRRKPYPGGNHRRYQTHSQSHVLAPYRCSGFESSVAQFLKSVADSPRSVLAAFDDQYAWSSGLSFHLTSTLN
jgi:hypothetical protein